MQGPPSPLQFDTALALEDQTIRAIAEAPMDILGHPDHMDLDSSGQDLSERDVEPLTEDQVKACLSQSSLKCEQQCPPTTNPIFISTKITGISRNWRLQTGPGRGSVLNLGIIQGLLLDASPASASEFFLWLRWNQRRLEARRRPLEPVTAREQPRDPDERPAVDTLAVLYLFTLTFGSFHNKGFCCTRVGISERCESHQ